VAIIIGKHHKPFATKACSVFIFVFMLIFLLFHTNNTSAVLPQPSWWDNTVCDTVNYPGSYHLGGSYNGVLACGPGPMQGGTDHLVHFFVGAVGEYEWECLELSMRYMYLAYDINPYYIPSGYAKDLVSYYKTAYPNGFLVPTTNNGSNVPTPGDIFSSNNGIGDYYGHTGVITAVNVINGNGTITILEQNHTLPSDGTRLITVSNGVLGGGITSWLHNPENGDNYDDDVFQATGLTDYGWRVSMGGNTAWQSLKASTTTKSSLMLGDFDNDGYTDDVFQATGQSEYGWRVSMGGTNAWESLKASTTTKASLMLGDFDNDGYVDDVFQASGVSGIGWRVSMNGTSEWQTINGSTTQRNTLSIGDFNHDGYIDDVFQASGVSGIGWRVSMGGNTSWQTLNSSTTTMPTLSVGDFDNDSYIDDVFQASGVSGIGWRVSMGGNTAWQTLNSSTTNMNSLAIGDFNHDGYTDDVFQATGISEYGWRVSMGGNSAWQPLKESTTTMDSILLGNF